ncbi:MAG: hypothetical protein JO093_13940 [Acidobacteria bacterium]|nr:hypothetical protein [Acidobacteriota bacterium]MBV9068568.1 hypothetical protein [Acidobacteriota bacterium]MBV9186716.1 hypothetical protein [Acidobacteriota bacterium]
MTIAQMPASSSATDSYSATETFVQTWIKARIDEPREIMARYDDAARQLIAVSALLQGVYLAVFSFGSLKGSIPTWLLVPSFVPLLAVVFCAATVLCSVPKDFNVHRIFKLLRGCDSSIALADSISESIKAWCESIDAIAGKKRHWLHRANISFIFASAVTAILVTTLAMSR